MNPWLLLYLGGAMITAMIFQYGVGHIDPLFPRLVQLPNWTQLAAAIVLWPITLLIAAYEMGRRD